MDPVHKSYLLFGVKKRRDAILDLVCRDADPFVPLFVSHMKKFGKKSLDEYSKIIIHILEYNTQLTFITSNFTENVLEYTLEDIRAEPDYRFRRGKTFMEWLLGPKS